MRIIYSLLLALVSPLLLFGLFRKKAGKPSIGKRWVEHFGFTPPVSKPQPIWIHAVSVGEVIAAKPVIMAIKKRYPGSLILVTTTTATGATLAENLGEGIVHRYMPIDFGWTVRGFLKRIRPKAMLIMETELWPNTLANVKKAGIPVIVLNARLSERSKKRYRQFQPVFNWISEHIDHIACQFDEDAARFRQLGMSEAQVSVTGSVKFDLPDFDNRSDAVLSLKGQFSGRPVWMAASTHAGEDEMLLDAHKTLLAHQPGAILILVPRHPERFDAVVELVKSRELAVARRSKGEKVDAETKVYVGDTMGEMMTLFAAADIAFMAGSLLGNKVGGHNLLEPASLAKPLLTGPSYFNFQVIGDQLVDKGACYVCDDSAAIAAKLDTLMSTPELSEQAGEAAVEIVNANRGAVARSLVTLEPWLD